MIRWIYSAKLCEKIHISDLRTCMGISNVGDVIRYNCLCWLGHLQGMDEEKWLRKIVNFKVNDSYHWGYPKKRWFENIRCDLHKLLWH